MVGVGVAGDIEQASYWPTAMESPFWPRATRELPVAILDRSEIGQR